MANESFDDTDAVMLAAETAIGQYPIKTRMMMDRIISDAEQASDITFSQRFNPKEKTRSIADAVGISACEAAEHFNVKAIVAFTNSGFTARMVSKYRPETKIIAFTPSLAVQRQLNLFWGVMPIKMDYIDNTDEIFQQTEKVLLEKKIVLPGDVIVILLGSPIYIKGTTNLMKLHIIGR